MLRQTELASVQQPRKRFGLLELALWIKCNLDVLLRREPPWQVESLMLRSLQMLETLLSTDPVR